MTDKGRELLANNEGNFKIAFFSLADDEVDYNIIEKFGRAVGKEKISKNTPVFEAQTVGTLAMKHRLLTLPNPKVVRLPSYTLTAGDNFNNEILSFSAATPTNEMTVNQTIVGQATIPEGVADTTFTVLLPDRFLTLQGRSRISIEATTRTATYGITAEGRNNAQGARARFTLQKQSIDDTMFTIYGDSNDKSTITGVVSIIGDQSGLRKDFSFQISK